MDKIMRKIKIIGTILIIFSLLWTAGWYYLTNLLLDRLEKEKNNKKITLFKNEDDTQYFSFETAEAKGFPFNIIFEVHGAKEENSFTSTTYQHPLRAGYNFVKQSFYVNYDGNLITEYKSNKKKHYITKLDNYQFSTFLPITLGLISTAINHDDPFEFINYLGEMRLSIDGVQVFQGDRKKLLLHKIDEAIHFNFSKDMNYKSLEDLMNNIPNRYDIKYYADTKFYNKNTMIPSSLLYNFSMLPIRCKINSNVIITTDAKKIDLFLNNFAVKGDVTTQSDSLDLNKLNFKFDSKMEKENKNSNFIVNSNFMIKKGFFKDAYKIYRKNKKLFFKNIDNSDKIDKEISYIMNNRDKFKLEEIEDAYYQIGTDINLQSNHNFSFINIKDLRLSSKDSEIKLKQNIGIRDQSWLTDGDVYVTNYANLLDFTFKYIFGYIPRFGKFRYSSKNLKKLYVSTVKELLIKLSTSNNEDDFEMKFNINSENMSDSTIGLVKLLDIPIIYGEILLKNDFDKTNDLINKIKEYTLDKNPLKKNLLRILDKNINKNKALKSLKNGLDKKLDKIIPSCKGKGNVKLLKKLF